MVEPQRKIAPFYAATDVGNGERLCARHGDDLRWVEAWRQWMVWTGKRWMHDLTLESHRRAKATVRLIGDEVARAESKEHRDSLQKWAHASQANARIEAMLSVAKADLSASADHVWDSDPWLLNVANGTLDLRTGQIREHRREDMITHCIPVDYEPGALCPTWEGFLLRVFGGHMPLVDYVQRAVGYSLTGSTDEQVLHVMHGAGANGKSTFLGVMRRLFGEYGREVDFSTFVESRFGRQAGAPNEDIARLQGARMIRASEGGEGKRLDETLIKRLTGNDTITARIPFARASFEFENTAKIWLSSNYKPVIRGSDYAIWRRIRLLPFVVTILPEERDHDLPAKLYAELPGILNWAIRGCRMWREIGLTEPEVVRLATEEYREESDVIGSFLEDVCIIHEGSKVRANELHGAYLRWAKETGEWEMSATTFGRKLSDRGFGFKRTNEGKWRLGLRLRGALDL